MYMYTWRRVGGSVARLELASRPRGGSHEALLLSSSLPLFLSSSLASSSTASRLFLSPRPLEPLVL